MSTETTSEESVLVVQNSAQETLDRLKAELRKAQPFADGTLVRFVSVDARNGQHFHYAAIFAGGHWWFTGQGNSFFPKMANQTEFSALLMKHGHLITNLELATDFAPIEL